MSRWGNCIFHYATICWGAHNYTFASPPISLLNISYQFVRLVGGHIVALCMQIGCFFVHVVDWNPIGGAPPSPHGNRARLNAARVWKLSDERQACRVLESSLQILNFLGALARATLEGSLEGVCSNDVRLEGGVNLISQKAILERQKRNDVEKLIQNRALGPPKSSRGVSKSGKRRNKKRPRFLDSSKGLI